MLSSSGHKFKFCLALLFVCFGLSGQAVAQKAWPAARTNVGGAPPLPPLQKIDWPRPAFPDISEQITTASLPSGVSGVIFETLDGRTLIQRNTAQLFNPASTTKVATALAALKTYGPGYRFTTSVWTNGTLDPQTGTIAGDLFLSGLDPAFHDEHAVMLAQELNGLGIKTVTGDLLVPSGFTMNFSGSAQRSGERLYDTLDVTRRSPAATRAWLTERLALNDTKSLSAAPPSVAVMGGVGIESVPAEARLLLTHKSGTLADILKVLLCFSNNFMAERLGDSLGGPRGIERVLINNYGVAPAEIKLASASGLGSGRVTPRAMMKIYRALLSELAAHNLSAADIMPVGGIDPGTLEKRFAAPPLRGSVIAKTGTLPRTGGGVSSLVGQTRTHDGSVLLFVIFNERGSVRRFRENQDLLVTAVQHLRGGPAPFGYKPLTLAMRLAGAQADTPKSPGAAEEFEPGAN